MFIDYESQSFPPSRGIPRSGKLQVTWNDVLWAALTLGRPNLHYVFRYGLASEYEALFRCSLVRMALEQNGPSGRRFRRTNAFKSLDPTEKGSVSYFLGMVICKIFADKLLGTPWLLHLDVFRDQLDPILIGRSRPDLVGQEIIGGMWHAFESKGRASAPGETEKTGAKEQAKRLISVDKKNCTLHIGAITYFKGDSLQFYWCDPEPEGPKRLIPIKLTLPDDAWGQYYGPVAEVIRSRVDRLARPEEGPHTVSAEEIDIQVGAHPELVPLLLDRNFC